MTLKRRDFITLLGGAAAAWPLAARAQQPAPPVVGFLGSETADLWESRVRAFRKGLSETGYDEGRNVVIEYRWANGRYDQLPALAADLVRRPVTVIAALGGVPSARAARLATATIPIVFYIGGDPVEVGLVASLNRPGGNLTGLTTLNVEVGPKRLEALHELVPSATTFALLVNPTNPDSGVLSKDAEQAAHALGLQLRVLQASGEQDFEAVFASLNQLGAGGLIVGIDPFLGGRSEQIAALAARYKVPVIWNNREYPEVGGLMSYGSNRIDQYRLAGGYTGRILKGEKPADLPIQQATRIELVVNLKAAKALGIDVPPSLLIRADEVIE
jgi:putative ABC transport system substrate-binding protein